MQLPEGDNGSDAEPSILKDKYGKDGEHPKFKRKAWLASVNDGKYDAGYWDWVSFSLKSSHVIRAHEKATKKVEEYVTGKHSEMLWKKILVKEIRVVSDDLWSGMDTFTLESPVEVIVCNTSEVDIVNWTDDHHCDTIYNVVPKLNASQDELMAFAERVTGKPLAEPSFEIYGYGAYIKEGERFVKTLGAVISNTDRKWYRNTYECPCGSSWEDEWDCMCDDRCPSCNTACSPSKSEELTKQAEPA